MPSEIATLQSKLFSKTTFSLYLSTNSLQAKISALKNEVARHKSSQTSLANQFKEKSSSWADAICNNGNKPSYPCRNSFVLRSCKYLVTSKHLKNDTYNKRCSIFGLTIGDDPTKIVLSFIHDSLKLLEILVDRVWTVRDSFLFFRLCSTNHKMSILGLERSSPPCWIPSSLMKTLHICNPKN